MTGRGYDVQRVDALDRALIERTQAGLPLVSRPYHQVARALGISPDEVRARLSRMLESGVIRRIAAVPNHYTLGYRANGMSVWDVADDEVKACGSLIGALPWVSHCYHRPRRPPHWPYNLFAMVHGRTRAEVDRGVETIVTLLGTRRRDHDVLFSVRILKKTGLRLSGAPTPEPGPGRGTCPEKVGCSD